MNRISVIRDDQVVPLLPGSPSAGVFSPVPGLMVERHRTPAIEIPEHEHSSLCLHLQTSRTVAMEWWSEGKNRVEQAGPGSLVLVAPGTRDRLRWSGASERVVVSLDAGCLMRAAEELGWKGLPEFRNRWLLEDRQLRHLVAEMQREMESGWATGRLYGELLARSLSVALLRKYASPKDGMRLARGGMARGRLRRVTEYIRENSHAELRLETLAGIAGLSVFHFARAFRMETGVSPHRYVLDERLRRARELLRLRSRTMAEIAAETGFGDAGSFARAFRRQFGVSPSEWKQQAG
jgi:AraC family transcriptional regulator